MSVVADPFNGSIVAGTASVVTDVYLVTRARSTGA